MVCRELAFSRWKRRLWYIWWYMGMCEWWYWWCEQWLIKLSWCMGSWVSTDYMYVFVYVWMSVWVYECMSVWVYECMDVFLSHTIPYHTIPYHAIPYHTIPYHTIPYYTIPYHTISYYTIPYHAILYHTIPYNTTPCLRNFDTVETSCAQYYTNGNFAVATNLVNYMRLSTSE